MSQHKPENLALWRSYISGELDANTESRLEALLQGDEAAFAGYAAVLSSVERELPGPIDEAAYRQSIIEKLPCARERKARTGSRRAWSRHPLLHYVIAATLTALLLGSGVFDHIALKSNQLIQRPNSSSLSERMMKATTSWLDSWQR
ncbi:hypothetical protein SAMN02744102_00636 [Paenibacillus barengoltzii]|uniref:hypothetical protein n=1 Tax=Paenibacillus barengoltzii TaxID=343517 RepID=UPI000A08CAB3|nr:hypothetical protein [Paenibacillus barengoltzii]SME96732.1 hypothetical protein SAMN02744102_00636 [Paenibacillus barengoltzii]